jgi:redox-sensitive bicupin YhaK (pirin superfamily)
LQIWIFPNKKSVTPRYDQKKFDLAGNINNMQLLVSPDGRKDSLWIYQDAFLSHMKSDNNRNFTYRHHNKQNGVFIFLLEGQASIDDELFTRRDTALVEPESEIKIYPSGRAEFIFIEVPVHS